MIVVVHHDADGIQQVCGAGVQREPGVVKLLFDQEITMCNQRSTLTQFHVMTDLERALLEKPWKEVIGGFQWDQFFINMPEKDMSIGESLTIPVSEPFIKELVSRYTTI